MVDNGILLEVHVERAQRRGGIEEGDDRLNYYVTESVGIACKRLICQR